MGDVTGSNILNRVNMNDCPGTAVTWAGCVDSAQRWVCENMFADEQNIID